MTGKRLATLNFPYTKMIRSTMTRAQQTADHILSQMKPGTFPIEDDKMLEEGAPYPPEPPIYGYNPLSYVSVFICIVPHIKLNQYILSQPIGFLI